MKKATLLFAALFALAAVSVAAPTDAEAQGRVIHKRTNKKNGKRIVKKKRTTTRRHTRHNDSRRHTHHRHRHRSGVNVRFRVGGSHHYHHRRYYHRPHYYRHDRTVVITRPAPRDVIVVESDPPFLMPEIDCPIRTDEVRVGMQQWCETSRGNKHGPYRRWYEDGILASEGEYEYDLKEGVWTEWHPNGAIREEGEYDDGERSGTWVTWGADGEELVVVDY